MTEKPIVYTLHSPHGALLAPKFVKESQPKTSAEMEEFVQFVQKHWKQVSPYDGCGYGMSCGLHIYHKDRCIHHFGDKKTTEEAWSAAYAFTVGQLKEIRLIEEEIHVVEFWISHASDSAAPNRILTRLQTALDEAKKGMVEP